jgi:hypothetical protein
MSKILGAGKMQDCWSRLVEDCRTGLLYRPVIRPERTTFESHNPHIDLTDVPVFFWGEMPFEIDDAKINEAVDAAQTCAIKLPYPRVAFLYHVASDNLGLYQAPRNLQNHDALVYVMVIEEEDDGSVVVFSFYWHYTKMDHWVKQAWQGRVTCGSDAQIEFAYDLDMLPHVDFMGRYRQSNEDRILQFLADLHRLMTHGGSVALAPAGKETQKINLRRNHLKLPDVPLVRVITFDDAVAHEASSAPSAPGAMKRPHFRRGTYRTLATGRRIWVRPAAIHGGDGSSPPWYEVRI